VITHFLHAAPFLTPYCSTFSFKNRAILTSVKTQIIDASIIDVLKCANSYGIPVKSNMPPVITPYLFTQIIGAFYSTKPLSRILILRHPCSMPHNPNPRNVHLLRVKDHSLRRKHATGYTSYFLTCRMIVTTLIPPIFPCRSITLAHFAFSFFSRTA
jgi:hypothetical protein